MLLWFASAALGVWSVSRVLVAAARFLESALRNPRDAELTRLTVFLKNLEDTVAAGISPDPGLWERFSEFSAPWSEVLGESLRDLRQSGLPVLPTLKRFRELAEFERESRRKARSRSAQVRMQAWVCALAAPFCAVLLPWLLPGIDQPALQWGFLVFLACSWGALGGFWIWRMAEFAGVGGLSVRQRDAPLVFLMSAERVLAGIVAGTSPDLAWSRAHDKLSEESFLREIWGSSIWESGSIRGKSALANRMAEYSLEMRKSIQVGLLEGRAVRERLEMVLLRFRSDLDRQVERSLETLATRALMPLFTCSAPSALLLLAYAVLLQWDGAVG